MRQPNRRVDRRKERQQEADDRHAERNIRSPEEQLAELDRRGCVAKKERAKLMEQMEPDHFEGNLSANIAGGRYA